MYHMVNEEVEHLMKKEKTPPSPLLCREPGSGQYSTLVAAPLVLLVIVLLTVFISTAGCVRKEQGTAVIGQCKALTLRFTQALAARNYQEAYGMISKSLQAKMTVAELEKKFEAIVPRDWKTVGPVKVESTMESWPDKLPSDRGWVYVSIGGDTESEAVVVIVTEEGGSLMIREIEFGRP